MAWDDELSGEQRRIASSQARVIRLVAGPGTGKTRVMTRRVAYLIEEGGVNPSEILALTFTRAATRELRQRLEDLLGVETGDRPSVFTLHAFALRQLLRLGGAPNLPSPIRIADDLDEQLIVKELAVMIGASVGEVKDELQALASDYESLAADEDEWEKAHPNPTFLAAWHQQREVYGYTLRAELVYGLKKALDEDPDIDLEPRFSSVLVDEYQDLNRCELAVIERLVGTNRQLFVAGDDDQSIYGFRNAFPKGLREFGETYPDAVDEELTECYRCDRDILAVSLDVARQDVDRIEKDLGPRDGAEQGQVEAHSFSGYREEARGIALTCRELVDFGIDAGKVLVLLRSNPNGVYSSPIVEALEEQGLEAELPNDPFAALEEPDGRRVVCLLRLLRDREDGLAWHQLLALRGNNVGDGALRAVYALAVEDGMMFAPALQQVGENPDAVDHSRRVALSTDVRAINDILTECADVLDGDATDGLEIILDAAGVPVGDSRAELTELLLGLLESDEASTLRSLEEALHSSRGDWDEDEQEGDSDRVQIMTMHTAKGLTAEAVVVAACEEELVPGRYENQRELDDQRRLLYVSLTRAKRFLFVTLARTRYGAQGHHPQQDRRYTRFLRDFLPPTTH